MLGEPTERSASWFSMVESDWTHAKSTSPGLDSSLPLSELLELEAGVEACFLLRPYRAIVKRIFEPALTVPEMVPLILLVPIRLR